MLTKEQLYQIAKEQSALELGCTAADFETGGVFRSNTHPRARKYLRLPFAFQIVYYGENAVISANAELESFARHYLEQYPTYRGFQTPALSALAQALQPYGLVPRHMAEYFLPDPEKVPDLPCPFETRLLTQTDFKELYLPEWSNALCADRAHLDVLGVGAYDNGRLIGLAACSADGEEMWQIGIDVLPEYRRQGIASALTARLTKEILARDKVPFYCAAWSNVASAGNAIKCGFKPAWVELTAKPIE